MLQDLQDTINDYKKDLMEAKEKFEENKHMLVEKNQEIEQHSREILQNETELTSLKQSLSFMNQTTSGNFDKKFNFKNPKEIESDLKLSENTLQTNIEKLQNSREKLRDYKLKVEEINLQIRMLLMNKNKESNSNQTISGLKKFTKEEIQKIQEQNEELIKNNAELEKEIVSQQKDQKNAEKESGKIHKDLKKLLMEYGNKRDAKEGLENKVVNHKIDNVESRRLFNLNQEAFHGKQKEFEVMLKVFNYGNYCKLKDEIKKRQIPGFFGLLIDLVDIPEFLQSSLNQLGLAHLFTIVVDTFETANLVIETNKDLKLGKINIYPLEGLEDEEGEEEDLDTGIYFDPSTSRRRKDRYPDDEEIAIFEELIVPNTMYMNHNKQIQGLIKDLFRGQIMVEKLETAIEYSKKYFVDCITLKGEIYRRGAITCDIGYTTLKHDCIQSYTELKKIEGEYLHSKGQVESFESGLRNITDELTKKTNECYELEIQKDKKVLEYKHSVSEIAGIKHSLIQMKKQLYYNDQTILENQNQVRSMEKALEINQNTSFRYSDESYNKAHSKLEKANKKLEKQMILVTQQEQEYIKLQNKIESIRNELKNARISECEMDLNNFEKNHSKRTITQKESLKAQLSNNIDVIIKKKHKFQNELNTFKQEKGHLEHEFGNQKRKLEDIQKNVAEINQKRVDYTNIIDKYKIKIASFLTDEGEVRHLQNKSDRGLIKDLSEIIRNTKHKYTEKDRLNFETLEANFSDYEMFDREMKNLSKSKNKLKKLINHSSEEMDKIHNKSVLKFKEKFVKIFEEIVVDGKAQVKITENPAFTQLGTYTNNNPYGISSGTYKGLEIITNFSQLNTAQNNQLNETQKKNEARMENLSPGQKTLVAICIALTFQSINPCAFYFLDEITADLDTNYVERVVDFIDRMSVQSQIFLTTFKPQLATFKEANYYMVKIPQDDYLSRIGEVSRKEAHKFLSSNNQ